LLAVLFGAGCEFYSDVLGARMLLGEDGVAMLADRFTPLRIRQYCWAIIDEGRRYFHQVVAPDDFDSGSIIQWPTSGLKDVIWKIRNVEKVLRPTFPEEWRHRESSRLPPARQGGMGKSSEGMWFPQMPYAPPHAGMMVQQPGGHNPYNEWSATPPQFRQGAGPPQGPGVHQSGQFGGPMPGPPVMSNPQVDNAHQGKGRIDDNELDRRLSHMHPLLKRCMFEYHKKFRGRVMLTKILQAGRKELTDLPTLNQCMKNGRSTVCYMNVLGHCGRGAGCTFEHPPSTFPDGFAKAICQVVSPGLNYVIRNESATPPKRGKRERGG